MSVYPCILFCIIWLCLPYYCLAQRWNDYREKVGKSIFKNKEGKYFHKQTGGLGISYDAEFPTDGKCYGLHPSIPVGTVVMLRTRNGMPITEVKIFGNQVNTEKHTYSRYGIIQLNTDTYKKIYKKLQFESVESAQIYYLTPIDSLLKELDVAKTNKEKIELTDNLLQYMPDYSDSLHRVYIQKAVQYAENLGDNNLKIKYLLMLANIKNSEVTTKTYNYESIISERKKRKRKEGAEKNTEIEITEAIEVKESPKYESRVSPDSIIKVVCEEAKVSPDNLLRWNNINQEEQEVEVKKKGGYKSKKQAKYNQISYWSSFTVYPDLDQLPEKEFEACLAIAKENNNSEMVSEILQKLAAIYRIKYSYQRAEQAYLEALKINSNHKNIENNIKILTNLIAFYEIQNKDDEAEKYTEELLTLYQNNNQIEEYTLVLRDFISYKKDKRMYEVVMKYQYDMFLANIKIDTKGAEQKYFYGDDRSNAHEVLERELVWYYEDNAEEYEQIFPILENRFKKANPKDEKERMVFAEAIVSLCQSAEKLKKASFYQKYSIDFEKDTLRRIRKINTLAHDFDNKKEIKLAIKEYEKALKLAILYAPKKATTTQKAYDIDRYEDSNNLIKYDQLNVVAAYCAKIKNYKKADAYYIQSITQMHKLKSSSVRNYKLMQQIENIIKYFETTRNNKALALKTAQEGLRITLSNTQENTFRYVIKRLEK